MARNRQRDRWGSTSYNAECTECGWRSEAKNALGNAARHYDATGHEVSIDVESHITYCSPEASDRKRAERAEMAGKIAGLEQ